MVTLNLDGLKTSFMGSIRSFLYPYQTLYSQNLSLNSAGGTLVQTFIPYSDTIGTVGIRINSIVGSPGPITLDVYSGSTLLKSGTISSTVGWNYLSVLASDIVTTRQDSIVVRASVSPSADYNVGSDTLSSYYSGSCGTSQMAFTVSTKDFIYPIFPMKQIDSNDLPVVSIDILGRPRIEDKYISGNFVWYYINIRAEVWSNYPREIDKILSSCDRGVLKNRDKFQDVEDVSPGDLSDLSYVSPDVYYRNMTWVLRSLISKE